MAPHPIPHYEHAFLGKRVYIAEDDTFIGKVITNSFNEEGMNATLYTTGEEILKAMDANVPDIVLLDILLPGMTGVEVLQKMRADARFKDTPVFVVSNVNQEQDREIIKKLNATFILKALETPEKIISRIEQQLITDWKIANKMTDTV